MFDCEELGQTCEKENSGQLIVKTAKRWTLEQCEEACTLNDHCRYIFLNSQGRCHLFNSCEQLGQVRRPGITKSRTGFE